MLLSKAGVINVLKDVLPPPPSKDKITARIHTISQNDELYAAEGTEAVIQDMICFSYTKSIAFV